MIGSREAKAGNSITELFQVLVDFWRPGAFYYWRRNSIDSVYIMIPLLCPGIEAAVTLDNAIKSSQFTLLVQLDTF